MTRIRARWAVPALAAVGVLCVMTAAGCRSSKKVPISAPQTVETTVTVKPPAANKVEYIDVRPWEVEAGQPVTVTIGGTPGRTGSVTLTGVEGEARGKTATAKLNEAAPGQYTATIQTGAQLPPGKYRIDAELSGGEAEVGKLASSRALTVKEAAPVVTACQQAQQSLAPPRVHFAFNRSDLDAASSAFLDTAATTIQALGDKVKRVSIEGHCDARGAVNYNLALGGRRANAVKAYLATKLGKTGVALETVSYGKERLLVADANTEQEHAQNRRAVLVIECR